MIREWSKAETAGILNAVSLCDSVEQLIKVINKKIPIEDLQEHSSLLEYAIKNFGEKDFDELKKSSLYIAGLSDEERIENIDQEAIKSFVESQFTVGSVFSKHEIVLEVIDIIDNELEFSKASEAYKKKMQTTLIVLDKIKELFEGSDE